MPVRNAEAIDLQRLPDSGQGLVHHQRTLSERIHWLVSINQRIEGRLRKVNRPGTVRLSLEQFAKRQAQHRALRYDHMKPRRSKIVRCEKFFVSDQRPKLSPFG